MPAKAARKRPTNVTLRADLVPTASIAGVEYVLKFHDLAAVPAKVLVHPVDSLVHRSTELIAALDLLFTGVRASVSAPDDDRAWRQWIAP